MVTYAHPRAKLTEILIKEPDKLTSFIEIKDDAFGFFRPFVEPAADDDEAIVILFHLELFKAVLRKDYLGNRMLDDNAISS